MYMGNYVGEIRQGPNGQLYQWVEGVDGFGNPIGFWKAIKKVGRAISRGVQTVSRIPGVRRLLPVAAAGLAPLAARGIRSVLRSRGLRRIASQVARGIPGAIQRLAPVAASGAVPFLTRRLMQMPGLAPALRQAAGSIFQPAPMPEAEPMPMPEPMPAPGPMPQPEFMPQMPQPGPMPGMMPQPEMMPGPEPMPAFQPDMMPQPEMMPGPEPMPMPGWEQTPTPMQQPDFLPQPEAWSPPESMPAPQPVENEMGFGSFMGEIRQAPNGQLYQWVEGADGFGNPFGFWKAIRAIGRGIRRVARLPGVRQLLPVAAGFIPGAGPAVSAGIMAAQRAGILGLGYLNDPEF